MSDDNIFFAFIAGVFLLLALVFVLAVPSLGSNDRAIQAVENLGLTNARVIDKGYSWGQLGGCSDTDEIKFTVSALDASGHPRTLKVCAGWPFGGYTVRN